MNIRIYLSLFLIVVCGITPAAQDDQFRHFDEVSIKIGRGDCSGADAYARGNIRPPILYTVQGLVQLDCRRNQRAAVEYFRLAARENEVLAIDKLISLGEAVPEPVRNSTERQTLTSPPLPSPPPMPQQAQQLQPQKIIIQMQEQQQFQPLNVCMQDGGSLYCPNHPSTRLRPPVYR